MKRDIIRVLLVVILSNIIVYFVYSDIIPDNSHSVTRDVVITNCNDFNDIQFIGYITGPLVEETNFYEINENEKLTKGYKFNTLYIFGISKTALNNIGGVENLTEDYVYSKVNPKQILSSNIYFINDESLLEKDEIFYEIVKYSNDILKVEIKKRILTFQDNKTKTINY